MTHAPRISKRARATGFTLIEALMAIFILAIGLLSLAAIFPAGIELLRRGADDLDAVTAANEVYGKLMSNSALASDRLNEGFTSMIRETSPPNGWMPDVNNWINEDPVRMNLADHWLQFTVLVNPSSPLSPAMSSAVDRFFTFRLADRVWPALRRPRFVWDVFVRRPSFPVTDIPSVATAARHMAGDVQMALILRPVDPEFARLIRETQTIDLNSLPRPPIAEADGTTYEAPRLVSFPGSVIDFAPDEIEGLRFRWSGGSTGPAGEMLSALRQPRQWILDPDGKAWRIARVRDIDGQTYLEFAPEPTNEQAQRLAQADLTFIYCQTPPVLIDVRTFKSGAGP